MFIKKLFFSSMKKLCSLLINCCWPMPSRLGFFYKIMMLPAKKPLYDLGYIFVRGQLKRAECNRNRPTNEPFHYNISPDPEECRIHYEEVGNAVAFYVYHMLYCCMEMESLSVPKDPAAPNFTNILVTNDYSKNDVLLILIQGSGPVRAGLWSRSVTIYKSLLAGTQIPYVDTALFKGYGVMILNPNDNIRGDNIKIPNSGTPEEHAKYVWDTYVKPAKASKIMILAHGYGGIVTFALAHCFKEEFEKRVAAIALIDSFHRYSDYMVTDYHKKVSKNWISCLAPLDAPIKTPDFDITRVSAGYARHEMNFSTCLNSVFDFFEEKLQ